jgi:hypothetical protein
MDEAPRWRCDWDAAAATAGTPRRFRACKPILTRRGPAMQRRAASPPTFSGSGGARHASNTSQKARCSIPGFGGAIGIRTSVQEPQRNLSSDQGVRPCRLNRPSPKLRRESALRRAKTAFVPPAQYQGLCAKVRKTYASRRRSPSGRGVGHAVTGAGEGNPETTHSCGISLQFAYRA